MRWLAPTLATAALALTVPAAAQTYGGYSYGYGQPSTGWDFDYRRCNRGESAAACRNRLQQRRDTRYGDYRYDYSRDYPRDHANYGYNYYGYNDYSRYGDSRYYGQSQPYYGGSYQGYDRGYYGNGYYGGGGYDAGTALALTVLGMALGVQIVGTVDDRDHYYRHRDDRSWRDWCRDRYNTFDWSTGTYLAQDGYRRYCRRW